MGLTALCPGTFDPVTNGHLDVIGRAVSMFDGVVVAVLENPSKASLFTIEERVALLQEALGDQPSVRVASFGGLLVDFARAQDAGMIVKGLRAVSDYDGTDESAHRRRGDVVHGDQSQVVVPLVIPREGGRAARR